MKSRQLLALVLLASFSTYASAQSDPRKRPAKQPSSDQESDSAVNVPPGYTSVGGDGALAPLTLSDASMYMQSIIHNYVIENGVKGIWSLKDKDRTWKLKLQEVVDDSSVRLGENLFVILALFRTERKPYHHLGIDFTVDFSHTPWTVTKYSIHEVDGKVIHPRPGPPPDPEDLPALTTGHAAAPS